MDDDELIRAFQRGDEAAFTELVGRHRGLVYRIARGILGKHEAADEASQEAFVKAWQGLRTFRGESTFKTWIHRIAMNTAFDLRAREMRAIRGRDQAAAEAVVAMRRDARLPVDDLVDAEQRERLMAAIERLPERQRLTLLLRVQGLTHAEVASTLDCQVGTAKANLHHAIAGLRRALAAGEQAGLEAARGAQAPDDGSTHDA